MDHALDALTHRGPSERGLYERDGIALGNTRLSIIDIQGGHQPIANEDGSVVVVYNGEIWNYRVLRKELSERGHRFRSESDTEVLVHGYEEWGDDLPRHLDGMFAFAIWDGRERRLLVARDRMGKKPLYLQHTTSGLAFGSDARTLFLLSGTRPALDRDRVAEYLFQRYTVAPATLFEGVLRLPAAHQATFDGEHLDIRRYWALNVSSDSTPLAAHELHDLLRDAVARRLMSDVPIGVLLSGGADSAAVLGLATELGTDRLATFTVGFDDPVYDERPRARISAKHFRSDHHELEVTSVDFVETLGRLAWYRDEPIAEASEIPLLLLAEFAGKHVRVALTGDGGDEIFGGYPKYRADALLRSRAPFSRRVLALMLRRQARGPNDHRQLGRALEAVEIRETDLRWASWFRSFDPETLGSVLASNPGSADLSARLLTPLRTALQPYQGIDAGRRMLLGDLHTYLPDNMLLRSDKVLMAGSLEGRMPLLDVELVRRVVGSPARDHVSVRGTKLALRAALSGLVPNEILNAPKKGFPVPVEHFLGESARGPVANLVLSERALGRGIFEPERLRALVESERMGSRHLFVLASLELWLRANVDQVTTRPPALNDLADEFQMRSSVTTVQDNQPARRKLVPAVPEEKAATAR